MEKHNFVSRGGIKLQAALNQFHTNVKGKVVLDVGSSTGGFVDCLLKNGALKVYAVDTAYGELNWNLRNNPKVVVLERTNILYLNELPEKVDLITIDAGWTKLELVLSKVVKLLKTGGQIIALLKPQYEVGPKILKKGLVSKDQLDGALVQILNKLKILGFDPFQIMESPILGGSGNQEFLLLFKPS